MYSADHAAFREAVRPNERRDPLVVGVMRYPATVVHFQRHECLIVGQSYPKQRMTLGYPEVAVAMHRQLHGYLTGGDSP